jgi:RNA polymerase sigma-70 factor (ECF subfamily)
VDKKVEITDAEIVEKLLRREEDVICNLLERYGDNMKSIIAYHLRYLPKPEQEACMNDVLFAIWNHADSYEPSRGELKNWICGVSKMTALGYLRKYLKQREQVDIEECVLVGEEDVRTDVMAGELSQEMEKLLSCLSEKDRELLLSFYAREENVQEMAKKHGIKASVIYKRMERAKKRVQKNARERRLYGSL